MSTPFPRKLLLHRLMLVVAFLLFLSNQPRADAIDEMIEDDRNAGGGGNIEHVVSEAKAGNPSMQLVLGQYLINGRYKGRDATEGLKWTKRAGENGSPYAFFFFGAAL